MFAKRAKELHRYTWQSEIIAPQGFGPVFTYKECHERVLLTKKIKKCVDSMRSVPDLMKLGAHGGLG